MLIRRHNRARGFTLVEMLVVIAIIGVLVGLLLPAVNMAVNAARRAQMATEIAQLDTALNAYKNKFGDFPPSLRGSVGHAAFVRHVRKCFPQISPSHFSAVELAIWPNAGASTPTYDSVRLDEGEALTFWLSGIDNDQRRPFKVLLGETPTSRVALYEFDPQRLVFESTKSDGYDDDGKVYLEDKSTQIDVDYPSYRAKYAKDTCFIHIDARSYSYYHTSGAAAAQAESGNLGSVRPYAADGGSSYVNPTTFQILCAGQDGEFGATTAGTLKQFPSGANYQREDEDNMTNFSAGRRLIDSAP